jgi:hypothetical protein
MTVYGNSSDDFAFLPDLIIYLYLDNDTVMLYPGLTVKCPAASQPLEYASFVFKSNGRDVAGSALPVAV